MSEKHQVLAGAKLPPLTPGPHRKRIGLISIVACFGGLLFGYDTGVANGAEGPMAEELGLSLIQIGVVISSLVFAAAFGALVCGQISDMWGRRKVIIMLAVLFFVGTLLVIFSPGGPEPGTFSPAGFAILVAGRIMLGIAVGGASTVVPVYLAEIAPYEIRGSITGRNELAIVVGQLSAFVVNAIIAATLGGTIDGIWRIMFAVCAVPAVALFIGMLRMPESPRWLVEKRRYAEALRVLKTVRPAERALAELHDVERTAAAENKGNKPIGIKAVVTNKWLMRIILVGIGVSMAQQLTGINSIMYYGTRVLEESGMSSQQAVLANIAFGVVAVVGGVIALRNMDRLDRRKTFLIGLSLTTICHVLVGVAGMLLPEGSAARPIVILVLVVAFVFSMQTFLNVAVWVWLAEIFPLHMRGLGIGISVFFGWTTNGFLALFFPSLVSGIGITGSFFLFAGIGVLALLFVATQVPETRGRTLEALEGDVSTGAIYLVRAEDAEANA
ncbi:sugar porter family MFS transporter [Paeniglutamicibacter sulfureus]|jgi:major inositol transporter-like SP family MFS transporter|uniref:Sugar porter (SP) family MFS transporter n=1 Tax=Paeniglutamicibacter sulfureus TaxID=43666 RepID=A0ABU2BGP2_9MICC|nr:sugar porter family MFS transporter [Paeniglutamicibacter sulfureus]MDO2933412.1 sugar porter family MFS transporter [Paeniglutamicibacter sulfureus]MDR7357817.1 sugar porter (SP) family MFS transporter [Paeniglutamicibacter sulfureus]